MVGVVEVTVRPERQTGRCDSSRLEVLSIGRHPGIPAMNSGERTNCFIRRIKSQRAADQGHEEPGEATGVWPAKAPHRRNAVAALVAIRDEEEAAGSAA